MKIFFEKCKTYLHRNPTIKKIAGIILILVGLLALVTPLTPGSWLMLVGLEFLGIRLIFSDKIIRWIRTFQAENKK